MDMGLVWTFQNLGAGNRSLVRERIAQEQQASIDFANVQDQVAQDVVQAHAQVEATASQVANAMTAVKEATITYNGTLQGLTPRRVGDLWQLVSRPQEAVAALEQLNRAYGIYFAAVNGYNRAQFQLYWALGFPARSSCATIPWERCNRWTRLGRRAWPPSAPTSFLAPVRNRWRCPTPNHRQRLRIQALPGTAGHSSLNSIRFSGHTAQGST